MRPLGARQRFGPYQVLNCLDFGVLGGLYRMKTLRGNKAQLVHVLPPLLNELDDLEKKLGEYINQVRKVHDKGVVAPVTSEEIGGMHCLIYPDSEGVTVNELAAPADSAAARPGNRRIHAIVGKIAHAMEQAHKSDLIHRMLCGGTVMVEGESEIRILGLGLYDFLGQEMFERIVSAGVPPLQDAGQVRLNPVDVLAPEARKGQKADRRADIYALGALTYFLLTGAKVPTPFEAPSKKGNRVSPRWDKLVERALHDNPETRYGDAGAFLVDLRLVEGTKPGQITAKKKAKDAAPGKDAAEADDFSAPEETGAPAAKKASAKKGGQKKSSRTFLVAAAAVVVLSLGVGAYLGLPDFLGGTETGPTVELAKGREPNLIVTVVPNEALVRFETGQQFLVSEGQIDFVAPHGSQKLVVEAPGHKTETRTVEVSSSREQIHLRLDENWAIFEVNGQPGIEVTASNDERTFDLGTIDGSARLLVEKTIPAGTYQMTFQAPGFEALQEELELPPMEVYSHDVTLAPRKASLKVVTEPEGAVVKVGGREVGKTPLQIEAFPVGEPVRIAIEHPEYRSQEISHQMRPGESGVLNLGRLDRKSGIVLPTILLAGNPASAADLAKATLSVNGREHPADSRILKDLPAGETRLAVSHPDYRTWEGSVTLADGGTEQVFADLVPQPAWLELNVEPMADYSLFINGFPRPIRQNPMPVEPLVTLNLEIRSRNYQVERQKLELEPNQRTAWNVRLERLPPPKLKQPWAIPYLGIEMVWVHAGTFMFGSPLAESERLPVEGPQTPLRLTRGYWLGRYEVTQLEYYAITGKKPSRFFGERHPVESLSWEEAAAFCEALTETERQAGRLPPGYVYRLPTEAEWEYACRAGTEGPFWFGSRADSTHGNLKGSYPANTTKTETEVYGTLPVGSYAGNPWGLYDMHGNVREWCLDGFASRLPGKASTDWSNPPTGADHAYRGGGWEDAFGRGRAASRDRLTADSTSPSLGFRVALAPEVE